MLLTSPIPSDLHQYYESDDYDSHKKENKGLVDIVYNWVKNYSFKRKHNLINIKKEDKTILDIGSGTGDFLLFCQDKNWKTKGIEPSQKARKVAHENGIILHEKVDDVLNNTFDVITMWHALEHVPNLYEQISQLKKMLKKEGKLFIAVPNFKSYDANYYKEFWAAYDVPRHLWHFSQKSIEYLFEKEEMKIVQKHPLVFDSFYVSMLSEKHKNGKPNYLKAFWIGLKSNLKAKRTSEYSSLIYEIKHA